MRRRGPLLILINRFLPGIRGVLFFAAGASKMPFGQTMALGATSALVYNLAVLGLGASVGGNAERLEALLRHSQWLWWGLLASVGVALLIRAWNRRRAQQK